ncbi:MauE/DoxX family redox-associated membrane protein [Algoriphagus terrigena]|uniref:MauE/DoxX family redox-associated membrane protein n=1 Tax=Algoriphagus terrigena TaxID=344884 RepID=UPI00054FE890
MKGLDTALSSVLILVFGYTGLEKFLRFEHSRKAFLNQPTPNWLEEYLAFLIPGTELLIALLLPFSMARSGKQCHRVSFVTKLIKTPLFVPTDQPFVPVYSFFGNRLGISLHSSTDLRNMPLRKVVYAKIASFMPFFRFTGDRLRNFISTYSEQVMNRSPPAFIQKGVVRPKTHSNSVVCPYCGVVCPCLLTIRFK